MFTSLQSAQSQTTQAVYVPKEPEVSDIDPAILLSETNNHRVANGLTPVTINQKLNLSALTKCSDMVARNYWSHNDPNGAEPWHFLSDAGYTYTYAGENQFYTRHVSNSKEVIDDLYASPTHKANIIKPNYMEVGFGVCKSEAYVGQDKYGSGQEAVIVVQHFGRPYGQ